MRIQRRLPGAAQALGVQPAHFHAELIDVGAGQWLVEAVEQEARLHGRQRVEVFDARGRNGQRVQLRLVDARQREVRRGHAAGVCFLAMGDQRQQLAAEAFGQGFDVLAGEALAAEGPVQLQLAAVDLAVHRQPVDQRCVGVLRGAAGFGSRHEQRVIVEALVELAQVVEGHPRRGQRGQGGACGVIAQVAQQAEAEALARHLAQLLLDGLDGRGEVGGRGQLHRVEAGEPADRAGQVDLVEQLLAAVAFQLHQGRGLPGPGAEGAGQGGQQQVVDLGAVGGGRLLQQATGLFAIEADADALAVADRLAGGGIGRRQRAAGVAQLRLPPGQFCLQRAGAGMAFQARGPGLQRAGLLRQRLAGVGGLQVFQQHAPGHAVHHQVVDHQQQALAAVAAVDQRRAQQRAVVQRQAALGFVAQRLQGFLTAGAAGPEQVGGGGAVQRHIARAPLAVDFAELQAQCIVLGQQLLQGGLQAAQFQGLAGLQQHRLVPVLALRNGFVEEPALHRGQRLRAFHRALLGLAGFLLAGHGGEGRQALLLEQVARGELQAGTAGAADHLDGDDGIATQLEEVVLPPYPLDAQHLLPDGRQQFLARALRGIKAALADADLGLGQGLAVEFAVGAQRHVRQQDHLRRHHVVRQAGQQVRLQRFAPGALGLGVEQVGAVRHQVGHQLLAAGAVQGQHHGFLHLGVFLHPRLDLAQLDAQAANLHLVVDTAAVLDGAVGAVARQVAGAVQALAAAEGVHHEALGGECRTAVVAARQAHAAQVQLAHRARGQRLQFGVEDMGAQVGDGPADGHAVAPLLQAGPVGDVDGRLGGAVEVVQAGGGQQAQGLALQLHRQGLAAADDAGQRGAAGGLIGADEGLQHGGHEMQGGDALLADQRRQALRVAVQAGLGHHQGGAFHQRPEEFPDRYVEAERGLLQHLVVGAQLVGLLHPGQAVVQRHMAVAGALGLAGGAGGVDDVGEVFRRGEVVQVLPGLLRQPVGIALQADAAHRVRQRQRGQQVLLGEQQLDAAVLDHVGQAVGGVFRVQRHIGAAGLEDRQQGHDHFQRALAGNPHQALRADALLAQVARQAVGALVQLGVGQALAVEHQRGGGAVFGHAGFDVLLHADRARVLGGGGVQPLQGGGALGRFQQRQLGDGRVRVGQQAAQQVAPVLRQGLDARGVEQVGGPGQAGQQALAFFKGVQLQVELGGAAAPVQAFHLQPRQRAVEGTGAGLLVVDHHLEQRAVAQAALALQGLHQAFEGQLLVVLGAQHLVAGAFQQLAERQAPVQLGAQHLGVDEETDQATGFRAVAVAHRHADAEVALAAVAVQQGLEAGQQEHEQGHPALPRQGLEAGGGGGVQGEVQARAALARLGRTRAVGGQFQQALFIAQLRLPPLKLTLQLAGFHPAALPQGVVGVLDRQRRQLHLAALAVGGVELGELFHQHAHGPAVRDYVVQAQHQHLVVVRQLQQLDPQQRAGGEVEGALDFRFHLAQGSVQALALRRVAQVAALQRQAEGRLHLLQHLAVLLDEARAQGLVARHQGVEAALQRGHVQLAGQAQGRRDVVGGALRVQLPEEPLALLGVGQRLPLLGIGARRDRQLAEAHALLGHALEELAALLGGQAGETGGDTPGGGVFHQRVSISSSSDSSASRRASLSAGACAPAWAA
ncbi:hypothetical protein D9M68_239720 [compost metagenome]